LLNRNSIQILRPHLDREAVPLLICFFNWHIFEWVVWKIVREG
jgi:hypothetical protein